MEPTNGVYASEDESDTELKAAIAASLRDVDLTFQDAGKRQVVDLTEDSDHDDIQSIDLAAHSNRETLSKTDEEDEDLKAAIALSLGYQNSSSGELVSEEVPVKTSISSAPSPFGILGLDRKKMEEERLARLSKRKPNQIEISPPPTSREKRRVIDVPKVWPASGSTSLTSISSGHNEVKWLQNDSSTSSHMSRQSTELPYSSPGIRFPQGVVKKTWTFGVPRSGDDIKIEEVLERADLELAILSSFMWDLDWLFTKINTASSRFLLVMQAKDEETRRQYEMDSASYKNIRLCFPPMEGQVNCMHSKLMILFHKDHSRLVVPSANLVPYDWGESGGVMENVEFHLTRNRRLKNTDARKTVFIIDLPKLEYTTNNSEPQTPFHDDLNHFLRASTVHENLITKLAAFDFAETARYAFVHTVGGSHTGDRWKRTGHCGLGRAVASLGLRTTGPINVDFVTSSVGSLTDEFLRSLYLAAQGDDGLTEYILRTEKKFPINHPHDSRHLIQKNIGDEWKTRFRVYFPTEDTVRSSRGGPNAAGTICFNSRWYNGPKFPRHVLRDCISRRKGVLMHNKMLFVRPESPVSLPDGSECGGWVYVGSANLSESAWGRLVQDRTLRAPKLNCRNWESGVLVPLIRKASNEKLQASSIRCVKNTTSSISRVLAEDVDIATIFEDRVPVPMRVPSSPYGPNTRPWFYSGET